MHMGSALRVRRVLPLLLHADTGSASCAARSCIRLPHPAPHTVPPLLQGAPAVPERAGAGVDLGGGFVLDTQLAGHVALPDTLGAAKASAPPGSQHGGPGDKGGSNVGEDRGVDGDGRKK